MESQKIVFAKSSGSGKMSKNFSATSAAPGYNAKQNGGNDDGDFGPEDMGHQMGGKRRRGSKKVAKKASKKASKKGSKKGSRGGGENPIVLAGKIAMALFHEFGKETDELNAKGN